MIGAIFSAISGAVGLRKADKQSKLAKQAMAAEDPFGPYRAKYAGELGSLMSNPNSFLQNPLFKAAFDLGEQGVARQFAGQGYIGSGNMAAGLQQFGMGFGWDALQNQEKFLAQLAGADINPDFSAALSGKDASVETMTGALGNLGGSLGKLWSIFNSPTRIPINIPMNTSGG